MAVGFVASASSGSQASVASFNIGTLGTGARAGIVFVVTYANSGVAIESGVTWNGSTMALIGSAADTDTEPGIVRAYFLDNVTNGLVTVSRTNNAVVCVGYAASISAATATLVSQYVTKVSSTSNTNANTSATGTGASGEIAVNDQTPASNSMRFAAFFTGASSPLAAGTNSTSLQTLDGTSFGSTFVRETTAGTGSRSVGAATGTTDDWAIVAVAVSEVNPQNPQPTAASLTVTGSTPTVLVGTTVSPTAASLTLTGATPTVTAPAVSLPTAASLALTGAAPTVTAPAVSLPTAGTLRISPPSVSVTTLQDGGPTQNEIQQITVNATGGTWDLTSTYDLAAFVLTGLAWDISSADLRAAILTYIDMPFGVDVAKVGNVYTVEWVSPYNLTDTPQMTADGSDLVGGGYAPTVTAPQTYAPDAAALALSGAVPAVVMPVGVTPDAATLALAGATPAVATPIAAAPDAAALTLSGATPSVATPVVVQPDAVALALAFGVPAVDLGILVPSASLTLSGSVPAVSVAAATVVLPDAAALVLAGVAPTVTVRADVVALPTTAALTLTGAVPAVTGGVPVNVPGIPYHRPRPQPLDWTWDDEDVLAILFA